MARLKLGEQLGGWTVEALLEPGGNAEVARVSREGEHGVIKVPRDQRRDQVTFERFIREIETQLELGEVGGVLHLLDHHIPAEVDRKDVAWLVTPLATPLAMYLKDRVAPEIVAAMALVAQTLSTVHAREMAHRDVKPDNLFWLEESPYVGDLGLIEIPDVDTVAEDGRVPGAFGFIADEVILAEDPSTISTAGWQSADVFATAKTMRALIARTKYPAQGRISRDDPSTSVARFLAIERTGELDQIIAAATDRAELRITMDQLATQLVRWGEQSLETVPMPESLAEAVDALKKAMRPELEARDAWEDRANAYHESCGILEQEFEEIEDVALKVDPEAIVGWDAIGDLHRYTETPDDEVGRPEIEHRYDRGIRLTRQSPGLDRVLVTDFCVEMTAAGMVLVQGYAMCGFAEVAGGSSQHLGYREAPMRTPAVREAIVDLVNQARELLPGLLKELAAGE